MTECPVSIVVIGAGNRTNKYMEYAIRHPEKLVLAGIVEPNDIRRENMARKFGVPASACFTSYEDFFKNPIPANAILIGTPENEHYHPTMMALEAGYNILLEKPIAQTLEECRAIAQKAREKGLLVGVCHVLRFHPYFLKMKEVVQSGELGQIISINHYAEINLDRTTHGYVRGLWNRAEKTNPMLLAKCCHDIDLLLWLTGKKCRKLSSFGSLRWFRKENAPIGSSDRCINCSVEADCPFSAVDLYKNRKEWVRNFDIPKGMTLDEVIDEELLHGRYGRCVYHCDNDVVDHQILNMELEDEITVTFAANAFTQNDFRSTHIKMTHGEIDGDERILRVRKFRGSKEQIFDFSDIVRQPYHAGADLYIVEDFVKALEEGYGTLRTNIDKSVESHRICFEAETSRLTGRTIFLD